MSSAVLFPPRLRGGPGWGSSCCLERNITGGGPRKRPRPSPKTGREKYSRRQRLAFGLRQERGRREAEDIDHRDRHRGLAEAAGLGDQPAGDERPDPSDEPRRVEDEAGGGRPYP